MEEKIYILDYYFYKNELERFLKWQKEKKKSAKAG